MRETFRLARWQRLGFSVLFLATLGVGSARLASAQVVLKPHGGRALPLRTKALDATVTIDGQFATTLLNLTFQNETQERIEADFIYTVPDNSLVTTFAYWYGTEKVQAKVVEKEEAAAIYSHITTRMRDPALVEMIGKNTFRARIFPVMPNSDLKVEMTLVHALRSDATGYGYTLPIRTAKGNALDSVRVHVHVKPNADIKRVTNASGLPITHTADGYAISLSALNYRPQRDLYVHINRPTQPLIASLISAKSGTEDGYFALTLTPDSGLVAPTVTIIGVKTYQLLPKLPSEVKAHVGLTLFGRYRGAGPARVTLTGSAKSGVASANIVFGQNRPRDITAATLWAARRMEQLSLDARNRQTVIALSKRHGIPSKYTSWLAVPRAEMERYEQEIAQAKMETVARRLAVEVSKNRENGQEGRRLRQQLKVLCKTTGYTPEQALSEQLSEQVDSVAKRLSRKIAASSHSTGDVRRLTAQLDRLCRLTGQTRKDALRSGLQNIINDLARQIADRVASSRERTVAARQLRAELDRLCRITGERSSDQVGGYLIERLSASAQKIVVLRHGALKNNTRLASELREFRRLVRATSVSHESILTNEEDRWTYREIERVRDALAVEYKRAAPDPSQTRTLKARFLALHGPDTREMAKVRVERLKVHADQDRLKFEREWAKKFGSSDLGAIDAKLAALDKREGELRARMGDPLISIQAPAGARQVIAVMPGGEIKRLVFNAASDRWEARFDIPTYATEGEYAITIVIVLADGSRSTQTVRYHVDLTAPVGVASARSVAGSCPTIRLEIEGSDDTARVKAVLPWGVVELKPGSLAHHFFALVPVPAGQAGSARVVTYVLTDRAHNRTTVTVDLDR